MSMLNTDGEPVHLAFPVQRGADGKLETVVQDTPEHLTAQVSMVVSYPLGYRPEKPTFGIPWPYGRQAPVDGDAIQAAVEQQVPNLAIDWAETVDDAVTDRILNLFVEPA